MLLAEYDYDVDIAVQREEALVEGEARGSHQAKLETAKTMIAMHYPLQDICKITGLTREEVENP